MSGQLDLEPRRRITPDQAGIQPKEFPFPIVKAVDDLRQGFRVTGFSLDPITGEELPFGSQVQSVAVLGVDIFTLFARGETSLMQNEGADLTVFEGGIRRREQLQIEDGSSALESWIITGGEPKPYFSVSTDKDGHLDVHEFSRRYQASRFDRKMTEELLRRMREDFEQQFAGHEMRIEFEWLLKSGISSSIPLILPERT